MSNLRVKCDTIVEVTNSSSVRTVGYNLREKALFINFKNGTSYRYDAVPSATFDQLLASPSKGAFVTSEIIPVFEAVSFN
jgi:hypothetical protein